MIHQTEHVTIPTAEISIVGGGLSGCLALWAIKHHYPNANVTLHEKTDRLGGNHTWCFHEADVSQQDWQWLRPLVSQSWPGYEVRFPKYSRLIKTPYHCIKSEDLEKKVLARYSDSIKFKSNEGLSDSSRVKILATGWNEIQDSVELGWQKFVGLEVELSETHDLFQPILKDVKVPQTDGYRFIYTLPLSDKSLLIEDTYYSNSKDLNVEDITKGILEYANSHNWKVKSLVRKEVGQLPLPLNNIFPSDASQLIKIGAQSGFINPVTGYTLPMTIKTVSLLAKNISMDTIEIRNSLAMLSDSYLANLKYLMLLNKMMFRAAKPEKRYVILERFYQLSEPLIERFYSAESTFWDRCRILIGKPPVPIFAAIKAILKN